MFGAIETQILIVVSIVFDHVPTGDLTDQSARLLNITRLSALLKWSTRALAVARSPSVPSALRDLDTGHPLSKAALSAR